MSAIQWRTAKIPARDGFVILEVCPLCGSVVIDHEAHQDDHDKAVA